MEIRMRYVRGHVEVYDARGTFLFSADSEAEAERMLEAMQNEEDKTRDKVNKRKAATVGKSGKNW